VKRTTTPRQAAVGCLTLIALVFAGWATAVALILLTRWAL